MHRDFCARCGLELVGQLCGPCLAEQLGVKLMLGLDHVDTPERIGALLRAIFVQHFTLARPTLIDPREPRGLAWL